MRRQPHEKAIEELRLDLDGAATPSRVAVLAGAFAAALEKLGGEPDGITLVISNRDLKSSLRGYDEASAERVRAIAHLVEDPIAAVQEAPATRAAAGAFSARLRNLAPHGGKFRRRGTSGRMKVFRRFDQVLVNAMEAASKATIERKSVRGNTEVYSPILRVGRAAERGESFARIAIGDDYRDVRVDHEALAAFYDAAKSGGVFRVALDATWWPDDAGALVLDVSKVIAVSVHEFRPMSGAELSRAFAAFDPSGFDDALDGLRER